MMIVDQVSFARRIKEIFSIEYPLLSFNIECSRELGVRLTTTIAVPVEQADQIAEFLEQSKT
jgi:hypothetical protein